MGWRLVSEEKKSATADLANWLKTLKSVPGERRLSPIRIAYLRNEIAQGRVRAFHWAVARVGADTYRVNGQHSSWVLSELNGSFVGTVSIETYVCDTIDDAVQLWSTFDAKVSSRSKSDILGAFKASHPQFDSVSRRDLSLIQSACAAGKFGLGYTNRIGEIDKCEALLEHVEFANFAGDLLHGTEVDHLRRVGVVYGMFCTFQADPEAARAFWRQVIDGTDPNPNAGSRALQRELLRTHPKLGQGAKYRRSLPWVVMADMCVAAWNAWRSGSEIAHFKARKDGDVRKAV